MILWGPPHYGAASMNDRVLYVLCVLLAVATPASPQQTEWKDPSPHATRFVTVEDGVQLEVLVWGGSGSALVLLDEDVLRVIDAVGVNNPVVIGHSFAGEEMHVLSARHSAKIRGLVYVDAAFDRGDDADNDAYNAVARTVPAAPSPQPGDLASFTALRV